MTQKRPFAMAPNLLKALALIVLFEATVLAAVALFFVVGLVTDAKSVTTLLAIVVIMFGATAWLFFVVRQILRGKRWARSAIVFWQLIQIAIALGTFDGTPLMNSVAVTMIAIAAAVVGLATSKEVVAATQESIDRED